MTCARCHGLMLRIVLDKHETGLHWLLAWRCVSCGDCLDSLIQQKRTMQKRQLDAIPASKTPRRRRASVIEELEV